MNSPRPPSPHDSLAPVLGLVSAAAIVVGNVIGSGIFFKPAAIARDTHGHVGVILSLWVICGLVNLCGALTLAELSAMFPRAGGTYLFLREAYGRMWAFLWAWAEFWVIRSGAIASLAVYSGITIESIYPPEDQQPWRRILIPIAMIALLTAVNIVGTRWGGAVQNVTALVKVGFVALLALLPLAAARSRPLDGAPPWPETLDFSLLLGIGAALASIMWAYDGWGNVTVVAEEIHDPERNVPRALLGGLLILVAIYTGANAAYHRILSVEEIAAADIPAAAACGRIWPGYGVRLVQGILLVSLVGALNGNILAGPRGLFAAARDHAAIAPLARVSPRWRTPAWSIGLMSAWAIVLIVAGDLVRDWTDKPLSDVLTNYCIFGGSLFYLFAVLSIFVLRRRQPLRRRPYRVWGYPATPLAFVAFYCFFLAITLLANWRESLTGLTLIAAGMVYYRLAGRRA